MRKEWKARLWVNCLTALGGYLPEIKTILEDEGYLPKRAAAMEALLRALAQNVVLVMWSGGQLTDTPERSCVRYDLIILQKCFLIETLHAEINGKPGGIHLTKEVLEILDRKGQKAGVQWIQLVASSSAVVSLFQKYGFITQLGTLTSKNATPMRRAITTKASV